MKGKLKRSGRGYTAAAAAIAAAAGAAVATRGAAVARGGGAVAAPGGGAVVTEATRAGRPAVYSCRKSHSDTILQPTKKAPEPCRCRKTAVASSIGRL